MFELTTGEMIDQLQYNEIALNDIFGTYVIRKSYGYMWCDWQGNIHRDKYFVISDMVKDTKWKILQ